MININKPKNISNLFGFKKISRSPRIHMPIQSKPKSNSVRFPGKYTPVSNWTVLGIVLAMGGFIALLFMWKWALVFYLIVAFVMIFGE